MFIIYEMNQCVAPSGCGRCEGVRLGDSLHCAEHNAMLKPLYLKYKAVKIDDVVLLDRAELETFSIVELLKYSSRVEQVYELRSEYRRLAFVPALWDRGHEIVIELCVRCLIALREILEEKFMCENELTADAETIDDVETGDYMEESNKIESPTIEKMDARITQIIAEEKDWGDSEAIRFFTAKRTRIEVGMNVLKSLVWKIYPSVEESKIMAITSRVIYHSIGIFGVVGWYRRGGWRQEGITRVHRLFKRSDILFNNMNYVDLMLPEIIHMSVTNSRMLLGLIEICFNTGGMLFASDKVIGYVYRNPDFIEIRVKGSPKLLSVWKFGTDYVWNFTSK